MGGADMGLKRLKAERHRDDCEANVTDICPYNDNHWQDVCRSGLLNGLVSALTVLKGSVVLFYKANFRAFASVLYGADDIKSRSSVKLHTSREMLRTLEFARVRRLHLLSKRVNSHQDCRSLTSCS